jgi:hypothetical protein
MDQQANNEKPSSTEGGEMKVIDESYLERDESYYDRPEERNNEAI